MGFPPIGLKCGAGVPWDEDGPAVCGYGVLWMNLGFCEEGATHLNTSLEIKYEIEGSLC